MSENRSPLTATAKIPKNFDVKHIIACALLHHHTRNNLIIDFEDSGNKCEGITFDLLNYKSLNKVDRLCSYLDIVGKVWKDYGLDFIKMYCSSKYKLSDDCLNDLLEIVYNLVFKSIDRDCNILSKYDLKSSVNNMYDLLSSDDKRKMLSEAVNLAYIYLCKNIYNLIDDYVSVKGDVEYLKEKIKESDLKDGCLILDRMCMSATQSINFVDLNNNVKCLIFTNQPNKVILRCRKHFMALLDIELLKELVTDPSKIKGVYEKEDGHYMQAVTEDLITAMEIVKYSKMNNYKAKYGVKDEIKKISDDVENIKSKINSLKNKDDRVTQCLNKIEIQLGILSHSHDKIEGAHEKANQNIEALNEKITKKTSDEDKSGKKIGCQILVNGAAIIILFAIGTMFFKKRKDK